MKNFFKNPKTQKPKNPKTQKPKNPINWIFGIHSLALMSIMLSCSQNLEPEPQKLQKSSFLSVEEQAKIALTSKRIFRATDDILLAYSSQKNATLDDVISNPASFLDDVIDDLKQSEDSVEFN